MKNLNNFVLSLVGMVILSGVVTLISNFFDIPKELYLPLMVWGIALLFFNIIADYFSIQCTLIFFLKCISS